MDITRLEGREPTTPIEDGPPPGTFWVRIQDNAEADEKPPERILEYPIPPEFALGAGVGMTPTEE